MKLKYYIRGFGSGVIFATIILMIAFAVSNNLASNQKKKTNTSGNVVLNNNETTEKEVKETTTEAITPPEETSATEENTTTVQQEPSTENVSGETVVLTIYSGMTSNQASDELERLGVVENGYDLNMFLYNNGYESRLRVGQFEIPKGASYQEIVNIITR